MYFPDDNVLAVGDAVTGAGWPSIDWWTGGWIGGMVGGLDTLFYVANDDTVIVPARGPVLTHADLRRQYDMYSTIWERLLKTLYSGGGPKEALAAKPTLEFDATMGPSEAFVERANTLHEKPVAVGAGPAPGHERGVEHEDREDLASRE